MAEKNTNTVAPLFVTTPTFKSAFESRREVMLAMAGDILLKDPRLDVAKAAGMGDASATKVAPFRSQIVATFGDTAGELLDELRPAALAARQADVEATRHSPSGDMSIHDAEVSKSYRLLLTTAEALVVHGYLQESDLAYARSLQGYQTKNKSLLVLVSLFREKWDALQGKTPLTVEQIDEAELVAQRMTSAIAHRDFGAVGTPAADLRHRALVRLVFINDEVRRMMTYLRWREEDVDQIVPSLFGERSRRRSDLAQEEPTPPASPAAPETPANPVNPTTPSEPEFDPTAEGGPFTP